MLQTVLINTFFSLLHLFMFYLLLNNSDKQIQKFDDVQKDTMQDCVLSIVSSRNNSEGFLIIKNLSKDYINRIFANQTIHRIDYE
jgi:hypothetical protein